MQQIQLQDLLFDLDQSKARSLIRIKEFRASPVDVLLGNLNMSIDPVFALDLSNVGYEMASELLDLSNLSIDDLNLIQSDLQYLVLDKLFKEFWEKIGIWIQAEIAKRETFGMAESILHDLNGMFLGKSLGELSDLKFEITNKINSGGMIDFDYWNVALKYLEVALAKSDASRIYNGFYKGYIDMIKKQKRSVSARSSITYPLTRPKAIPQSNKLEEIDVQETVNAADNIDNNHPQKFTVIPKEFKHLPIMKEAEFQENLLKMIKETCLRFIHPKLQGEGGVVEHKIKSQDEQKREQDFIRNSKFGITPEESVFRKDEVFLPCSQHIDIKYRLRKPKYYNSIKTIVEWNKYNSSHFNEFNPPPKIVDGYKFNLYYPDLIDKSKPPNYQISPDATEETRILRFSAGQPYSDIAFRIVNKPWDICHRRGFRVDFEKSVYSDLDVPHATSDCSRCPLCALFSSDV